MVVHKFFDKLPACGDGQWKRFAHSPLLTDAPTVFGLSQFFADRRGGISNLIDGWLQFVSGNAKMLGPIFHL